jgi:glycerol-3-phosphate dehydrogenase
VRAGDATRTAALSRDHTVLISATGLVSVTGGKWTTYRKMGEDAIGEAAAIAGLPERASKTRSLKLHGHVRRPREAPPWDVYGGAIGALRRLIREEPALDAPLHPRLPYRAAQVVWAARREMARTVEDVLSRRTRALLLDARASVEAAPVVASLLARELGKDALWRDRQVEEYSALANSYLPRRTTEDR